MDIVALERRGAVALLTLNRPQALNALDAATLEAIEARVGEVARDPGARALVVTGEGRAFAAGADIAAMRPFGAAEAGAFSRLGHRAFAALEVLAVPTIAAVNGYALGGGCELALCCDLIVAGTSARFGQPEIRVGIMPGAGGTQRLPRIAGPYRAMKLLLTGDAVVAPDALAMGLVSEVVPDGSALERALAIAQTIASMPPLAVRAIKEVVHAGQNLPLEGALSLERKAFQLLFDTEDQKEGMRAFLEKRKPVFRGR